MNSEVKNYKVTIFGNQYSILSDEPYDQVHESVAMLDTMMQEMAKKNQISNTNTLAVLVALKVVHSLREYTALSNQQEAVHGDLVRHMDQTLKILRSIV
jgi:cell division protein ZapA (FtsZ GTPase activity inhibitor)